MTSWLVYSIFSVRCCYSLYVVVAQILYNFSDYEYTVISTRTQLIRDPLTEQYSIKMVI